MTLFSETTLTPILDGLLKKSNPSIRVLKTNSPETEVEFRQKSAKYRSETELEFRWERAGNGDVRWTRSNFAPEAEVPALRDQRSVRAGGRFRSSAD